MTTKKGAAKTTKTTKETEVNVIEVRKGVVEVCVIGRSPLICNAMSQKSKQTLLFPGGPKNQAERAGTIKHEPLKEYRESPYKNLGDGPTRLQGLASWFKKASMTAALDLPNTKKTQIGRLVNVLGDRIDIYGTPQIMSSVVRNSDMNHTPDVRTRAILPRWACKFKIAYVIPIFTQAAVLKLLAAGGMTAGVGDWRVEKGAGNYGQYELVLPSDPEFQSILKEGRRAQDEALESPIPYDDETLTLLAWYDEEIIRRNKKDEVVIPAEYPVDEEEGGSLVAN